MPTAPGGGQGLAANFYGGGRAPVRPSFGPSRGVVRFFRSTVGISTFGTAASASLGLIAAASGLVSWLPSTAQSLVPTLGGAGVNAVPTSKGSRPRRHRPAVHLNERSDPVWAAATPSAFRVSGEFHPCWLERSRRRRVGVSPRNSGVRCCLHVCRVRDRTRPLLGLAPEQARWGTSLGSRASK